MQEKKIYQFNGVLETIRFGHITSAVFLPHHIITVLPKGRLRASGHINGTPFSLAIHFRKTGGRFLVIGAALKKVASLETGDSVNVSFRILRMYEVEIPDTLELVTHEDRESKRLGAVRKHEAKKQFQLFVQALTSIDSRIRNSMEVVQRGKVFSRRPQPNRKNKNK